MSSIMFRSIALVFVATLIILGQVAMPAYAAGEGYKFSVTGMYTVDIPGIEKAQTIRFGVAPGHKMGPLTTVEETLWTTNGSFSYNYEGRLVEHPAGALWKHESGTVVTSIVNTGNDWAYLEGVQFIPIAKIPVATKK
jgi:hypothetical protein